MIQIVEEHYKCFILSLCCRFQEEEDREVRTVIIVSVVAVIVIILGLCGLIYYDRRKHLPLTATFRGFAKSSSTDSLTPTVKM